MGIKILVLSVSGPLADVKKRTTTLPGFHIQMRTTLSENSGDLSASMRTAAIKM